MLHFTLTTCRYCLFWTALALWIAVTASESTFAQQPLGAKDGFAIPDCTRDDDLECKEECRSHFDQAFHRCVKECLAPRCSARSEADEKETSQRSQACLEIESPACSERCRPVPSAEQSRCRRDCLKRACPEGNELDAAEEALNPGALACTRCKQRVELSCRRQCGLVGPARSSGLQLMGCELVCVSASCGHGCAMRLR